ncbi:MAG: hypothetical protein V2A61_05645 [Calditrichota bacterium]
MRFVGQGVPTCHDREGLRVRCWCFNQRVVRIVLLSSSHYNLRVLSMKLTPRFILLSSLFYSLLAPHLRAQDSTGFIDSTSRGNAGNPLIGWRESWLSGDWFNLSFTDNFSLTYRFYGQSDPPPVEELVERNALNATWGDFSTTYLGPQFLLLGYVVEDETWCILPAVLSPEYVQRRERVGGDEYVISEIWYSWREFWERIPPNPPKYLHEETYTGHDLTIWGRLPPHKQVEVW